MIRKGLEEAAERGKSQAAETPKQSRRATMIQLCHKVDIGVTGRKLMKRSQSLDFEESKELKEKRKKKLLQWLEFENNTILEDETEQNDDSCNIDEVKTEDVFVEVVGG